jgi:hypothetical protein
MAAVDPVEEWNRLSALYAEMGDLELLELNNAFSDLTDGAQRVLRAELEKRKLWDVALPAKGVLEEPVRNSKHISSGDLRFGGVTVREYETSNEAKLACYVLELAGIPAVVVEGSASFDLRLPLVRVAPEDAERADMILAQPIPAETRADHEASLNLPDFEVPLCPHCHTDEVLLEATEPNNRWVCDHCGHHWEDAISPS